MLRRKILFFISDLEGGGAERIVSLLLHRLDNKKFEPYLVLFAQKGIYLKSIPNYVQIYSLDKNSWVDYLKAFFRLGIVIHEIKPDVIISFLIRPNLLLLCWKMIFKNINVIISERSITSTALQYDRIGWFLEIFIRHLFPKAEKIIAISNGIREDLWKHYKVPKNRINVIYNPIDLINVKKLSNSNIDHPWFFDNIPIIICVGRLEYVKGQQYLIRAISLLKTKKEVRLVLVGTGSCRKEFEKLTEKLKISQLVAFVAFSNNPFVYLRHATIVVVPSLSEGFGNAITEAMGCSIPVIASDCPSGPGEIIKHGESGLLVKPGDSKELAIAIDELLENETLRKKLILGGNKRCKDFNIDIIIKEYEKVLLD